MIRSRVLRVAAMALSSRALPLRGSLGSGGMAGRGFAGQTTRSVDLDQSTSRRCRQIEQDCR